MKVFKISSIFLLSYPKSVRLEWIQSFTPCPWELSILYGLKVNFSFFPSFSFFPLRTTRLQTKCVIVENCWNYSAFKPGFIFRGVAFLLKIENSELLSSEELPPALFVISDRNRGLLGWFWRVTWMQVNDFILQTVPGGPKVTSTTEQPLLPPSRRVQTPFTKGMEFASKEVKQ